MKCFTLIVALLASALISITHADNIGWHPQLAIFPPTNGVGRGIDLNHQKLSKQYPAVLTTSPIGTTTGGASVDVSYSQHKFDLAKSFSLNASVSVDAVVYSGKVGLSFVDNQSYSQNTVNFTYVAKRDFGKKFYAPTGYTTTFADDVNFWKASLSGDALKKTINDAYGTHFVSGYQSMARVIVNYSFQYESQSAAQSFALSISGSYGNASFSTDVKNQLERTDTKVSMSYHFDTTDSLAPWPRATDGSITNYAQFLDFTSSIDTYTQGLNPANAQIVSYEVEPIENIPGYNRLVGGLAASAILTAEYDRFMTAYGQLKKWDDLLSYWSLDPRRMSWLNTNGQQLVVNLRKDTTVYIRSLEDQAKRHFQNGEPLLVPDSIFDYFSNFNRIPLPTINTMYYNPNLGGTSIKIGYAMCGSKALTRDKAFTAIKRQYAGSDYTFEFCYTMAEWAVGGPRSANYDNNNLMASPIWNSLAALTNNTQILIFYADANASDAIKFSLQLEDDAGNIVESSTFPTIKQGLSPQSYESSTNAALSFGVVNRAAMATLDTSTVHEFAVTNNGPGAAYGISVSLPIPSGLQVLYVSGSQGSGSISNGNVVYAVGPLASGNSARIRLTVAPTRTNNLTTASLATTTIGEGLTNTGTNSTSALDPITVHPPSLTHTKKADHVELSWVSDTGLLNVESSSRVGTSAAWGGVPTPPTLDAGRRKLRLPFDSNATFYRLRSQ